MMRSYRDRGRGHHHGRGRDDDGGDNVHFGRKLHLRDQGQK